MQLESDPPVTRVEITLLVVFLRVVGGVSLLAFAAAVMPQGWIVRIAETLGFDPFPDSPLTFYLARNLSLLYGFVGATLMVLSFDVARYRPLFHYAAMGTVLFGFLQLIVDSQARMPLWWTWGESISTLVGGLLFFWIQFRAFRSNL
jgi:hypothetical protein